MNPTREARATLVDLLDRVLDKGLILDADLIIHVAGIPLLGVKLSAALAGMETMLRYGIWQDWDEAQRAAASEEYRRKMTGAAENEAAIICSPSAGTGVAATQQSYDSEGDRIQNER